MKRMVNDLPHRSCFHNASCVHDTDPVRHFGNNAQVVRDQNNRHVALIPQICQQIENLRLNRDIKSCGRLVCNQNRRPACQRHSDHHPLKHSSRHLMRIALCPVFRSRYAHLFQKIDDFRIDIRHIGPMQFNGLRDLRSDAEHRIQGNRRFLKNIGNLSPPDFSQFAGREPQGKVTVGVMETICASRYGGIFRVFRQRYPKVNLKVVVATTLECMAMLEKGTLDVILTVDKKLHHPHWISAHELATEICFFCSSGHPFAGGEAVPVDTLIRESFIQIEEGCNYRQAFEQYLNDQGKYITNVMEIGYTRLIIDAVAAGLGVSLLPRFTLEEALERGEIAVFPVAGYSISMLMQVIYSENRWLAPPLQAFLHTAREILI